MNKTPLNTIQRVRVHKVGLDDVERAVESRHGLVVGAPACDDDARGLENEQNNEQKRDILINTELREFILKILSH